MLVAVSQRVDVVTGRNERRDALDQRLAKWLLTAGYLAVPVPNQLSSAISADPLENQKAVHLWLDGIQPSAVVLSGGNDVGEYPERDATECDLLSWAKTGSIPVLGICRGMQMMAVWAGATLKPVMHHVRTRHQLRGTIHGEVNSFHNLALSECPHGFEVLARADDDEIEAIRHNTLPFEGWMWHPEREFPFSDRDRQRLKELFN